MRQQSSYPKPFKAQVVQECLQPGASVSSVAISHGINANVIRKWLPIYGDKPVAPLPAFVRLQPMPKRHADEAVVIELPLGEKSITIKWPISEGCRVRENALPKDFGAVDVDRSWNSSSTCRTITDRQSRL
ncbi:transposase [Pseudomonas viridiflava]|uniref:transposase n=1 Tax=Pseudomonas viridiflava TaxID=33069 RepID=UPI000F05D13D|nr:transposase [Pseudomonas viridiflava]